LDGIKDFGELNDFLFERVADLQCKKTGLFILHPEPVDGDVIFLTLEGVVLANDTVDFLAKEKRTPWSPSGIPFFN